MPFSGGGNGGKFSIQGVLKFQIGSIFFFNTPTEEGNPQYSMAFSQVGVSLLGKKLPPSGDTVLYLFGNPKGNDVISENGNLAWFGAYRGPKQEDTKKRSKSLAKK